jgi:hypothetical protein
MVRGGQEGFLDRVLGRVDVGRSALQRAKDLRRELAQQVLDPVSGIHRGGPDTGRLVLVTVPAARP